MGILLLLIVPRLHQAPIAKEITTILQEVPIQTVDRRITTVIKMAVITTRMIMDRRTIAPHPVRVITTRLVANNGKAIKLVS